jgi:uncharacterized coiled-coil protein SlyX
MKAHREVLGKMRDRLAKMEEKMLDLTNDALQNAIALSEALILQKI